MQPDGGITAENPNRRSHALNANAHLVELLRVEAINCCLLRSTSVLKTLREDFRDRGVDGCILASRSRAACASSARARRVANFASDYCAGTLGVLRGSPCRSVRGQKANVEWPAGDRLCGWPETGRR